VTCSTGAKVIRTRLYVANHCDTPDADRCVDEDTADNDVEEQLHQSELETPQQIAEQPHDQEFPEEPVILEAFSTPVCIKAEGTLQQSDSDKEKAQHVQDSDDEDQEHLACRGSCTEEDASDIPEEVALQEPRHLTSLQENWA